MFCTAIIALSALIFYLYEYGKNTGTEAFERALQKNPPFSRKSQIYFKVSHLIMSREIPGEFAQNQLYDVLWEECKQDTTVENLDLLNGK